MKTTLAQRQAAKRWRDKNKERLAEYYRARRANDPAYRQAQLEATRRSWVKNKASCIASHSRWRAANPNARLADCVRAKLRRALRLSASTRLPLSLSVTELRSYLASLFVPPMSWDNYGSVWEVDHIRPLSSFDLSNPVALASACHHSNLQPLLSLANRSKSARPVSP